MTVELGGQRSQLQPHGQQRPRHAHAHVSEHVDQPLSHLRTVKGRTRRKRGAAQHSLWQPAVPRAASTACCAHPRKVGRGFSAHADVVHAVECLRQPLAEGEALGERLCCRCSRPTAEGSIVYHTSLRSTRAAQRRSARQWKPQSAQSTTETQPQRRRRGPMGPSACDLRRRRGARCSASRGR